MIDSHAHLESFSYDSDRSEVIKRCREHLTAIITIGSDLKTSKACLDLSSAYDFIFATVGIHPETLSASLDFDHTFSELGALFSGSEKIVAIGEAGLDYHYPVAKSVENRQLQQKYFQAQIGLALARNLPLVIHSRDSFVDTFKIVSNHPNLRAVWHSFTGSAQELRKVLDLGFYVAVNGIITFDSAGSLRHAVKELPLDRLILETDAPFLAPVPYRGQRCEPWMVKETAKAVAKIKNCSLEAVVKSADQNTRALFSLINI